MSNRWRGKKVGGGGDKNELFDSFVIFMPLKYNRLVVRVGDRGRERENRLAWWQRDDGLSFITPNGKSY